MKITTKAPSSSGKKEFVTVPEGRYLARISRIQDKQSDRTGSRSIQVALEVVKGPMSGNAVFENFLYDHSNEKAVEVGSDRSKKLGKIFGISIKDSKGLLDNSDELMDKELIINVKNTEREFNGEMRTFASVTKFEPGL